MAEEKLCTEIRREQIVEAAFELLGTQDPATLSVASVARRVGLVPSAVYRHFRGKDEILDSVVELIGRRLLEIVQSVRDQTNDSLERLRRLLMRHIRFVRENSAIPRIILADAFQVRESERKSKSYKVIRAYLDRIMQIVAEGQEAGKIRRELDAQTVASGLLGIVQSGAVMWYLSDGDFDVTRHAQRGWELLATAIESKRNAQG